MKAATGKFASSPVNSVFQSTPPVKAATKAVDSARKEVKKFQSTPPVKAATISSQRRIVEVCISIHAAREGGDFSRSCSTLHGISFQSTPPVKAATGAYIDELSEIPISIHAAREGGDRSFRCTTFG